MKKLHKCEMCGERIVNEDDRFVLKEEIRQWQETYREGSVVCVRCLVDFIEDTVEKAGRVPRTLPQIICRHYSADGFSPMNFCTIHMAEK